MPLEEILNLLRARPFVPFRVHVMDGASYEVMHPELLMPGARSVLIGFNSDQTQPFYEPGRTITVSLLGITRLEPLQIAKKVGDNGN